MKFGRNFRHSVCFGAAILAGFFTTGAFAATEVQFWHAFTGRLGELVDEQVATFNSSQSDYEIVASHKGNYSETLNAGIAAFLMRVPNLILMPILVPSKVTTQLQMEKCCLCRSIHQRLCYGLIRMH